MLISSIILIVVAVGFAWNLGVHYTGAVMGMPYAARSIALWPALILIAVLTILGATFASGGVETTVGLHIINDRLVTIPDAIIIVLSAGSLTLLYNYQKIPTSTIQILVFCVVGVGLAGKIPIYWITISKLAVVWVCAPLLAFGLGFLFTRLLDLVVPLELARAQTQLQARVPSTRSDKHWFSQAFPGLAREAQAIPPANTSHISFLTLLALRSLPLLLVCVGIAASFVLGANDVSNATGVFILTHLFSLPLAGLIGGIAMAVGTLTWGRRILKTVAFDVVKMDLTMASAAQGVQALVVLLAVTQGLFTSMNQALIGAMAGAGLARGRETVQRQQILGILRGWLIGPLSGIIMASILEWLAQLLFHLR
ncbi:inorganic phosphate transporter [Ktedonosporobacter rubrisoli]|uniref:Phosphate transporter n=1 Tax=Ktedonosporobacter rubrisoli TaxID=2509675 RepID=A0A4V0YYM4_KTERU|nr:inorganic phosphate transporter [Ktedonosporobacter rubrisoli]QBD76731.1 inorganic phosphate transporter [Ktedonosporobacter rubrisoli]